MDDSYCVLVEFINEGNTIAIGFRSWISPELFDDELQDVITKQEIVLMLFCSYFNLMLLAFFLI